MELAIFAVVDTIESMVDTLDGSHQNLAVDVAIDVAISFVMDVAIDVAISFVMDVAMDFAVVKEINMG